VALGVEHWDALGETSAWLFFVSGVVGLAIGDIFLFRGYQRLGSARTIMVFSFSPLFLTLEGFLFFGQGLSRNQFFALLLMMACVWTISLEKFRERGHWEWKGILFAAVGVLLDNIGVVLSRKAFDLSPEVGPFTANAVRAVGAILPLLLLQYLRGERAFFRFGRLEWRDRALVVFASFTGTFLSLSFWLTAIKIGHIGSLAGVGSFNPVAASLWEWLLLRKRPTPYLVVALAFFLSGFYLLLSGG
jgi:drug/metabolite transporter (DMT)-like permease